MGRSTVAMIKSTAAAFLGVASLLVSFAEAGDWTGRGTESVIKIVGVSGAVHHAEPGKRQLVLTQGSGDDEVEVVYTVASHARILRRGKTIALEAVKKGAQVAGTAELHRDKRKLVELRVLSR